MDTSVKVVKDQVICIKYNHNEQVILVIMDDQVPIQDRFLCNQCLKTHINIAQMLPIHSAIASIKEKINLKQDEYRDSSLKILKEFCEKMNDLQSKIIKFFNEIQRIAQLWITDIGNKEKQPDLTSIIKGLESPNIEAQVKNEIEKTNKAYYTKLELIFKKLLDTQEHQNCQTILQKVVPQEIVQSIKLIPQSIPQEIVQPPQSIPQEIVQPIKETPIIYLLQQQIQEPQRLKTSQVRGVKVVQIVKQEEYSSAMAFNCSNKIMVSGCDNDLIIWKFDNGNLAQEQKLIGHTSEITSIVFSKKLDWFATGSADRSIRGWAFQNSGWISSNAAQKHTDSVMCLILNKDETQLISCSLDKNIIVWKVNCQLNQLVYDQKLEKKHTGQVYGISLNEQETELVSCSSDKKIILWTKDKNNQWIFLNQIINNDQVIRISFIDNRYVIWQQEHRGVSHLFKVENGQLIKSSNIELNKESVDNCLFPTIYNKLRQIVIQKHNKYVYVLQYQDNKLILAYEPISCQGPQIFGTLTQDGQYLVLWDQQAKEFRVLNII